jgi:hypothetical protein
VKLGFWSRLTIGLVGLFAFYLLSFAVGLWLIVVLAIASPLIVAGIGIWAWRGSKDRQG